jgi:NADPH:quinone reductase-like Zn-dependent oxidoreductase
MLGDKKIQPLIERKIKIDQAAEAHQIIENRQNKGKIIFQLN